MPSAMVASMLRVASSASLLTRPLLGLPAGWLVVRLRCSKNPLALIEPEIGFLLVSGNAYVEAVALGGEIRELHVLRPDRMKVVPGPDGWPEAYDYSLAGRTVTLDGEPVEGVRRVLHLKLFQIGRASCRERV